MRPEARVGQVCPDTDTTQGAAAVHRLLSRTLHCGGGRHRASMPCRRRPRPLRPVLTVGQARVVLAGLAGERSGVLYSADVVARGVPRWLLHAELRAGRWQRGGRQTVVTHNGPLDAATRRIIAVLEVGPRAALDGVTALQHLGVKVDDDGWLHVIAPKSSTPRHPRDVRVHESRRFAEDDVQVVDGTRVVRAAVAAVHAALWARTDREAQLFPILAVQQRLASPQALQDAVDKVRRSPRRLVLRRIAADLTTGVRSVGELDVARALRSRGLPEPDRQVLRRRASGKQYLDCRFERYGLTVEVDGIQHDDAEHRVSDVLRDLVLVAEGDAVLRIPLVVWRLDQQRVLDALEQVFRSRGWRGVAA
jgi:very-short-patch-repair endonuclease